MDWLNLLKTRQEAEPDTIQSFSIMPQGEVSKGSKALAPEHYDIFDRGSLVDLLRDRQRELDALGDWTGCRGWLDSQDALLIETRRVTKAVDAAFQRQDAREVRQAIETYSQTWRRVFETFAEHHH